METPHLWVGVWVVGWMDGSRVGSGQVTKNQIKVELIKIIQFCLKIYDLWRHPHLWVGPKNKTIMWDGTPALIAHQLCMPKSGPLFCEILDLPLMLTI